MAVLLIFLLIIIATSFTFKTKIAGKTENNDTSNVKIMVLLK